MSSSSRLVQSHSVVYSVWSGSVKLHARCASCSVSTSVSSASIIPPTLHLDTAVIRRTSGLRLAAVGQNSAISGIGEQRTEKYCLVVFGVTGTC